MKNKNFIILKNFFTDMHDFSREHGFFRFAYQSRAHWMIICLIGCNQNNGIAFEEICNSIDRSVISRSTIQNILDNGNLQKIFFKKKSNNDGRIKLYFLSENAFLNVNKWIERQNYIFSN